MRLKTTKRLLNLASLAMLASAGAVGYWGLSPSSAGDLTANHPSSIESATLKSAKPQPSIKSATAGAIGLGGNAIIATNWVRPLRRPLFDPPPVVAAVVKPPPQPLQAKLLATLVEPENSTAMIKHANGQVVYRKVGDSLGADEAGTQILSIETGSISVRRGQDVLRLSVEGSSRK